MRVKSPNGSDRFCVAINDKPLGFEFLVALPLSYKEYIFKILATPWFPDQYFLVSLYSVN